MFMFMFIMFMFIMLSLTWIAPAGIETISHPNYFWNAANTASSNHKTSLTKTHISKEFCLQNFTRLYHSVQSELCLHISSLIFYHLEAVILVSSFAHRNRALQQKHCKIGTNVETFSGHPYLQICLQEQCKLGSSQTRGYLCKSLVVHQIKPYCSCLGL